MTTRGKLLPFALVGVGVAALYVALYTMLQALGVTQSVANAAAFLAAVVVQYAAQACFTFQAPLRSKQQVVRFGIMVALGFVTSAIITGLIGPSLGWPDLASAIIVTIVLPFQNYVFMSRWVFLRRSGQMEKQP
ncbi:GtrA family protein [Roseovarius sp. 2305UL8-3]|uniref:GtrA family protein n=1 Tax=Roseovarius conchicola TaxID=3121636 RepID=UPI003528902A